MSQCKRLRSLASLVCKVWDVSLRLVLGRPVDGSNTFLVLSIFQTQRSGDESRQGNELQETCACEEEAREEDGSHKDGDADYYGNRHDDNETRYGKSESGSQPQPI